MVGVPLSLVWALWVHLRLESRFTFVWNHELGYGIRFYDQLGSGIQHLDEQGSFESFVGALTEAISLD